MTDRRWARDGIRARSPLPAPGNRRRLGVLFSLVAMMGLAWLASACGPPPPPCTTTWVGPAGGNFNVPTSWDTGAVPAATTVACAPTGSSIVLTDARTVNNVQLAGTLRITPTATLTLATPSTIDALTLEGNIAGAGNTTITTLTWSGGRLLDTGVTLVTGSATITGTTGTPKLANNHTLALLAPTTITSPVVRLCDTATFTVAAPTTIDAPTQFTSSGCGAPSTARIDITDAGTLTTTATTTISQPLDNAGLFRITGPTTTTIATSFTQTTGTVDIADTTSHLRIGNGTGTLTVGGTLAGTGTIDGSLAGTPSIAPGPTTPTSVGTLRITGDVQTDAGSHLALGLAGPDPSQTDHLTVDGNLDLTSSSLDISYRAGFVPTTAQTFPVITAGGVLTGPAASVTVTDGTGTGIRAHYDAHHVSLTVNQCDTAVYHPHANLMDADLGGIDLAGCDLTNADLDSATGAGTNLTSANLRGVSLVGSVLTNADLTGADLTGALTDLTTFATPTWAHTTCPDGTNSDDNSGTCTGHLLAATPIVVNASVDGADASPGDGVCQTATPGQCTLRAAIQESNASTAINTVVLAFNSYAVTIPGDGEDHAATGDLDITASVRFEGNNAYVLPTGAEGVFQVMSGVAVAGDGLNIGFNSAGDGVINDGNLHLEHSYQYTSNGTAVINRGNLRCNSCSFVGSVAGLDNTGAASVVGFDGITTVEGRAGGTGIVNGGWIQVDHARFSGSVLLVNSGTATLHEVTANVVDGSGGPRIQNTGTLTAADVSLPGGSTGILNQGTLSAHGVNISHLATAISNGGTMDLADSSILGSTGIAIDSTGPATVTTTTLDGNRIGVRSTALITIDRTTVSHSTGDDPGSDAAISSTGPGSSLAVTRSTISGNAGRGVVVDGGASSLTDTTVAFNAGTGVVATTAVTSTNSIHQAGDSTLACDGSVTSGGWNLVSDTSCAFTEPSDLVGSPTGLEVLAGNGGPTATHLLLDDSPAIDTGPPTCAGTDQRGADRPIDGDGDGNAGCDRGAVEVSIYRRLDLTVDATDDAADLTPGDGICETAAPARCTLRAAVMEANQSRGIDTISLPAGVTLALSTPLPSITTPLHLHGNDAGITRAPTTTQALTVSGRAVVDIDHLRGDLSADNIVGVTSPLASVTITDTTVRTFSSYNRPFLSNVGSLTLQRVTSTNVALDNAGVASVSHSAFVGAGIVTATGATTTIDRVTVTQVPPPNLGLVGTGITNHGTTTVTSSTIARNGAAIDNQAGSVLVSNSILSDSSRGSNCINTVTSLDWNLSSDASCSLGAPHDLSSTPADLGLIASAGAGWYLPLQSPSAAIDSGQPGCAGTDSRGVAVPIDGDGDGDAGCDRGAAEAGVRTDLSLTVTSTADTDDSNPGDGVCAVEVTGLCTLRAALEESGVTNGSHTIDLQPGATYVASSAGPEVPYDHQVLWVAATTTLHGHGATIGYAASGVPHDTIGTVGDSGLVIDDLTVSGAIRSDQGDVTLSDVSVANVTVGGALTIQSSKTDDVRVPANGSGHITDSTVNYIRNSGQLDLERVTVGRPNDLVTGYVETDGPGASTVIRDSTLASATNAQGSTLIDRSTIAGGSTGLSATSGSITVTASIILPGGGANACVGPITSGGWNVAADSSCALGATGDLNNVDPQVGPLARVGQRGLARIPEAGSPAIDSGYPSCAGTDLVGVTRPIDGDGDGTAACDRGAWEVATAAARTFTVTSTLDRPDVNLGDHICETATPGECTLRAAIMEANVSNGTDTVELQPGATYPIWLPSPLDRDPDGAQSDDLDISSPLTLHGHGATLDVGLVRGPISGFDLSGPVAVTIDQLTVIHGATAVNNRGAMLTLTDVDLRDVAYGVTNAGSLEATGLRCHDGCGRALDNAGTATIDRSWFDATSQSRFNSAVLMNSGSVTLTRSTIESAPEDQVGYLDSDPSATFTVSQSTLATGPIRLTSSTMTMTSSTVSGWSTAIFADGGASATVTNSILVSGTDPITGARPFRACMGVVSSGGYNIVNDTFCNFTATGDLQNVRPNLMPLGDHGGPTRTMPPMSSSPAIDSGAPGCGGTDQRLLPRPVDGDGNGAAGCDRGAVEQGLYQPLSLTVTSTIDAEDVVPGDGICETATPGQCTLRAALQESAAVNGDDVITLQSHATYSFGAGTTRLPIASDMTISGNNATVDGLSVIAPLELRAPVWLRIKDLTIAHAGRADATHASMLIVPFDVSLTLTRITITAGAANGIENHGYLVINDSRVTENAVVGTRPLENYATTKLSRTTFDHNAGGIVNHADLRVDSSTLSRTTGEPAVTTGAPPAGGATVTTTIRTSTISGNAGAGVHALAFSQTWVYESTLTANSGPGLWIDPFAVAAVQSSIVADQLAGPACTGGGGILSGGYNLSSDTTCNFNQATDQASVPANLGALAANGGLTFTHLPNVGSAVIDTGNPACAPLDQRGIARPRGAGCDRGAVER